MSRDALTGACDLGGSALLSGSDLRLPQRSARRRAFTAPPDSKRHRALNAEQEQTWHGIVEDLCQNAQAMLCATVNSTHRINNLKLHDWDNIETRERTLRMEWRRAVNTTTKTLFLDASGHVKGKAVIRVSHSALVASKTDDWLPAADGHVTQL